MEKRIAIILTFLLLWAIPATAARRIVTVQSISIPPYETAIEGFADICEGRVKRIVMSELTRKTLADRVGKLDPDLILAVGLDALKAVSPLADYPMVYVMVLNPGRVGEQANVTGIRMQVSPELQLQQIRSVFPTAARVGLLFHPDNTGSLVDRAMVESKKFGIELVAQAIRTAREVPGKLSEMAIRTDLFWMLPDIVVVTPQTLEFLLLHSVENQIPLISFSAKYLEMGACMSIEFDVFDMGRQAGEMANRILSGTPMAQVPQTGARKAVVTVNRTIANKFGIVIDVDTNRHIRVVDFGA
ncbi:MAG: ABC transporter substrate-binding protein [Deltaproteobacteria bacterium]|nr:ABC transporter substrate-binding protein [Deltaproteobacteria bacterium]